jgi:hypothetical protein
MMSEPNLFDTLKERAMEIVRFHGITHGVTFTDDEMEAIGIGAATGVHASIDYLNDVRAKVAALTDGIEAPSTPAWMDAGSAYILGQAGAVRAVLKIIDGSSNE